MPIVFTLFPDPVGGGLVDSLAWAGDFGVHHADFGRGRYSVARTHGRVPRFVVRWHRSRGPFTEGKNITGRPALMLLRFVEHSKLPVAGKI